MLVQDLPKENIEFLVDSQDVDAAFEKYNLPQRSRTDYDSLFVTENGNVYGMSGIVPYIHKYVYPLVRNNSFVWENLAFSHEDIANLQMSGYTVTYGMAGIRAYKYFPNRMERVLFSNYDQDTFFADFNVMTYYVEKE